MSHIQVLINAESSQYVDSKGKTEMHQAAEQVSYLSPPVPSDLLPLFSSLPVYVLLSVSLQGCAKAVSLIKAVRPTSVDDIDINGYQKLLLFLPLFVFGLLNAYKHGRML